MPLMCWEVRVGDTRAEKDERMSHPHLLVSRADPHLQDLALLWDLASQAVPLRRLTPPAG